MRLDAGLAIGAGYRLIKGNGMNIGLQYYLGLVDIRVDDSTPDQFNRVLYLTAGIPIGKNAKRKKLTKRNNRSKMLLNFKTGNLQTE